MLGRTDGAKHVQCAKCGLFGALRVHGHETMKTRVHSSNTDRAHGPSPVAKCVGQKAARDIHEGRGESQQSSEAACNAASVAAVRP